MIWLIFNVKTVELVGCLASELQRMICQLAHSGGLHSTPYMIDVNHELAATRLSCISSCLNGFGHELAKAHHAQLIQQLGGWTIDFEFHPEFVVESLFIVHNMNSTLEVEVR